MNTTPAIRRERQQRFMSAATIAAPTVDLVSRTCELSFSSTAPVQMLYGMEVLSHASGAADLTRLNAGAPLLFNHDQDDILGVVERAYIAGNKGRAVVRFGRDERGDWAMHQAADGVLVNVSFAYAVHASVEGADGDRTVTRWEALEISLVTVPADQSVGIGRSFNFQGNHMQDHANPDARSSRSERAVQTQQALLEQARNAGALERARIMEIGAMGRRFNMPEAEIVSMQQNGLSVDEARERARLWVGARQRSEPTVRFDGDATRDENLGLSDHETRSFSLVRAINAVLTGDWSNAGLERAASRAVEGRSGRATEGFFVPPEVMRRGQWSTRAAYAVGAYTTGGALVETTLQEDAFIDVLRNSALTLQAGATALPGLQGNLDIPRQTGQTPAYWVGEGVSITEGEATFDTLQLRPKTVGALSFMSRLMLMQSTPAIETLVRADLAKSIALAIDQVSLSGSGSSNQPLGVANASGISVVILGTNGANVSLDTLVALETNANQNNAPMDGRAYFVNPKTAGTLKNLKSSTGQYLWTDSPPGQRSGTPHMFNGYPVYVTNQVRSNLSKGTSTGVCSEIFFGAWPDLLIAQWGALEIVVNPYATYAPSGTPAFGSGAVGIRAMQTVDIGIRHAASFIVCSDALTP